MHATAIDRRSADHYQWGTECDGWHLLRGAELSVIEESMPAGTSEVPHYHRRSEQFFYILRGEATMEVAGALVALAAGQGLHLPPGTPHCIHNRSAAPVEFLVISRPPSHGDRVVLDAPAER